MATASPVNEQIQASMGRQVFRRFLLGWFAFSGAMSILDWWLDTRVGLPVIPLAIGAGAWLALRLGRERLARRILVICSTLIVGLIPLYVSGVRSPALVNAPLLILMAGWLLGRNAAAGVTATFVLATLGYWFAETNGLFVPPLPVRSSTIWLLALVPTMIVTGATAWLLIKTFAARLAQEQALRCDLDLALAESRRARDALDNVSSYVYMKDREGRYIYANKALCSLFALPQEEIMGCREVTLDNEPRPRRCVIWMISDERDTSGRQCLSRGTSLLWKQASQNCRLELPSWLRSSRCHAAAVWGKLT